MRRLDRTDWLLLVTLVPYCLICLTLHVQTHVLGNGSLSFYPASALSD
jgi:hypothetical protein